MNDSIEGTAAGYQLVVDGSEALLKEARAFVPDAMVVKEDARVSDLDTDPHRLPCSNTTSQYTNRLNLWLAAGSDGVDFIDAIRASLMGKGFDRVPSVDEQDGGTQDPAGSYAQVLQAPDGYGLTVSRGDDTDGTTILQLQVFSPCVANPADRPSKWGLF